MGLWRGTRAVLMIEANKAYAPDEEHLRWILQAWERSPEAVSSDDPGAARLRLERRVGQIEERLEMLAVDHVELKDTLWSRGAESDNGS